MLRLAVQLSPDGLVARAEILSLPLPFVSRRLTVKEPLGAVVLALVLTATLPLRRVVTFQVTPFLFWSTSNSVSRRPSSGLTLSFVLDDLVQLPATCLPLSPCLPRAVAGTIAATATAMQIVRIRVIAEQFPARPVSTAMRRWS